jgi:hypothetical protein
MSKDKEYLKQIISSAQIILEDVNQGLTICQKNLNNLGYVDGVMVRMQQDISKNLTRPNSSSTYVIIDDEHGNCL